jgi:hypothetical protein
MGSRKAGLGCYGEALIVCNSDLLRNYIQPPKEKLKQKEHALYKILPLPQILMISVYCPGETSWPLLAASCAQPPASASPPFFSP